MRALKKIAAIFFLLVLFFQFEGTWLLFFLRHQQIKNEISDQIAHDLTADLILVKIPKHMEREKNFQWIEEDEFRYLGNMYDVVKQEEKGDSLLLYCIADQKDDLAYTSYKKNQQLNDAGSGHNHKTALSKLIGSFYLIDEYPSVCVEHNLLSYGFLNSPTLKRVIVPPYLPPKV